MTMAAAADAVADGARRWLGSPAGSADDIETPGVAAAAVAWAVGYQLVTDPDDTDAVKWWPGADNRETPTYLGLVMLTARLVRRRNSPGGIEGFGADTGAAYVRRNDPDVAMLLGLDGYRRLVVG